MIQFWGSNSACSCLKPGENSNCPVKSSHENNVITCACPLENRLCPGSGKVQGFYGWKVDGHGGSFVPDYDFGLVQTDLCLGFHQAG